MLLDIQGHIIVHEYASHPSSSQEAGAVENHQNTSRIG